MIFYFNPWILDIDIAATERLYREYNYSENLTANMRFVSELSEQEREFFACLGVNPMRIHVDESYIKVADEQVEDNGKIFRRLIDFLMCGRILGMPDYQVRWYSDPKGFNMKLPKTLQKINTEEGKIAFYDVEEEGIGVVFKHPCMRSNREEFRIWDCGYVLGSILQIKEV